MGISGEEKQSYHNRGEQDYAKGEYNPPTTAVNTLGGFFMTQNDVERQEAYDAGYNNAKNQK